MAKHVHHVVDLADEMSILLDRMDECGAKSSALQQSQVSHLCKITPISLVKHRSGKLCFRALSLLYFVPCLWSM